MESKFVTFLVFASLAPSSHGSVLKVDYGLPPDGVTVLEGIMDNKDKMTAASSNGVVILFDKIQNWATQTDDLCSEINGAFDLWKNSTNLILDSIQLLLGGSSSTDIEDARITIYEYLDDAAYQINSALELAKSGNYYENQAAIEDYRGAAKDDFAYLVEIIYELISNGLHTDTEVVVVIESSKNASLVRQNHSVNAVFNAIQFASVAVDAGCEQRKTLVTYIEALKGKALSGLNTNAETIFTTIETLHINFQLNLTGIASILYNIISAQIISQARYTEGNIILFGTVNRFLDRIRYGLSDDGEAGVSQNFLELQEVTKVFDAGDASLFASDLSLHPDAAAKIATTQTEIHTINEDANVAMYSAATSAAKKVANCTATLEQIEVLRHAAVDPASGYTDIFFGLIRNNKTYDDEIESLLVYYQNLTTIGAQIATGRFLDAVVVLANATCKGEVTEETFSATETLLAEAIDGLQYFTQSLAAAALSVLRIITASQAEIGSDSSDVASTWTYKFL